MSTEDVFDQPIFRALHGLGQLIQTYLSYGRMKHLETAVADFYGPDLHPLSQTLSGH